MLRISRARPKPHLESDHVDRESAPGIVQVLPVSASPLTLDALLTSLRGTPSSLRILPTLSQKDSRYIASQNEGEKPDVILLDLRGVRPSVAYRHLVRIRSHGRRTGVVLAIDERDLSLIPMARQLGVADFVLPTMSRQELIVRLAAGAPDGSEVQASGRRIERPGEVEVNWRTHEVISGGSSVKLTLRELQLFEVLMSRSGLATHGAELARMAWGKSDFRRSALAATQICSLRKKLACFGDEFGIRTVRGAGYCFELLSR